MGTERWSKSSIVEVSGADIAVPLDAGPVVVEAIPADEPVPVPVEVLSPAIDAPVCPLPPFSVIKVITSAFFELGGISLCQIIWSEQALCAFVHTAISVYEQT